MAAKMKNWEKKEIEMLKKLAQEERVKQGDWYFAQQMLFESGFPCRTIAAIRTRLTLIKRGKPYTKQSTPTYRLSSNGVPVNTEVEKFLRVGCQSMLEGLSDYVDTILKDNEKLRQEVKDLKLLLVKLKDIRQAVENFQKKGEI
jgi:hypothetical protein